MEVVCVNAFGGSVPGDVVEVPDGAGVSEFYFAPAGSVDALRAIADAAPAVEPPPAAAESPVQPPEPPPPPEDTPPPPVAVSAPDAPQAGA